MRLAIVFGILQIEFSNCILFVDPAHIRITLLTRSFSSRTLFAHALFEQLLLSRYNSRDRA